MRRLLHGLVERQLRFWTAPTSGASVALFRIGLGIVSVSVSFELLLNRERFFGDGGVLPWSLAARGRYAHLSVFSLAPQSDALLLVVALAMLVASIALTLGIAARTSAFVAWACMVSFAARNPYVMNGGDRLFTILLLIAVVMPLARKWSVAAIRRARRDEPPGRLPSIWGVRLGQLQVAWMYAMTGFAKVPQPRWQDGTMMRDVLASPVYCEWPVTLTWPPLYMALTYGVLLFECLFAFTVWGRRTRVAVLGAGAAMHLGILVLMVIPLFSIITLASYLLFVTDEESERFVRWLRRPTPFRGA